MAILNYTTTVDAFKTVSEIEYILMKHKAKDCRAAVVKDGVAPVQQKGRMD